MDYQKIYKNLIESAQLRPNVPMLNGYTEIHHIIPKSLGGSNSSYNLVRLTAREHFIAHWLLYNIYKYTKYSSPMIYAFNLMRTNGRGQKRYYSSRGFEIAKKAFSIAVSNFLKGRPRTAQHAANIWKSRRENDKHRPPKKRKIMSEEAKIKISNSLKGFRHSDETKIQMSLTRTGKSFKRKKPVWNKGRKGEIGEQSLTNDQIKEIYELFDKMSIKEMTKKFSVGRSLLYQLRAKFREQESHLQ